MNNSQTNDFVVVDNGLVLVLCLLRLATLIRLNPYCSGQWSRTGS